MEVENLEELVEVLREIRDGIYELNTRVDGLNDSINDIKGYGVYNSLTDIHNQVKELSDEIKGHGLYNNLSDVCDKLENISNVLHSIDMNTM